MRPRAPSVLTAALLAAATALAGARQAAPASATTVDAIVSYPSFYHGRPVAIVGSPTRAGGLWMIDAPGPVALAIQPASGQPPLRTLELRGTILDPLALAPTDSRRAALRAITDLFGPGRAGEKTSLLVLAGATWLEDSPPAMTLRQVVMHPARYANQMIAVRGRFHGRNLFDELPALPPKADANTFVLQAADAAIWVTGLPPKGDGFAFDPALPYDTSRWLRATGVVRTATGQVWIEGAQMDEVMPGPEVIPVPVANTFRLPRPAVIFSAPVDHDEDVDPTTTVRVQFSRDIRESTFNDHVTVRYDGTTAKPPAFTIRYRVASRSIELRFAAPLLSGATVVIRFDAGVTALDSAPLEPTEITFRVVEKPTT